MTDFSRVSQRFLIDGKLAEVVSELRLQQNYRCVIVQTGAVGECAHVLENAFR